MSDTTAYLLVIHGSRDPRPAIAAQQIAHQLQQQWPSASGDGTVLMDVASLELAPTDLHQQILQFGDRAIESGCRTLAILPLFLLPGVHVCDDIPGEVAIAQTHLGDRLTLQVLPYLGQANGMVEMLAHRIAHLKDTVKSQRATAGSRGTSAAIPTTDATPIIVLAHGSRRPGGNQPIEAIATQLNALAAYWAVSPSLDDQIQQCVQSGAESVIVLPYFLAPGGITDAIAAMIGEMGDRYPKISLTLADPLGDGADMVDLIFKHLHVSMPPASVSC